MLGTLLFVLFSFKSRADTSPPPKKKSPFACALFCFVYFHKRLQSCVIFLSPQNWAFSIRQCISLHPPPTPPPPPPLHHPPPPPPAALAEQQKLVGVCVTTANICATFKIYETKCCRSTIYLLPHINSLSQRMFYSNFGPLEANISFVRGPEIETAEPYV